MPDTVPVCAEVNDRGEAIAFALDWPGACGWGPSLEVALAKLERDIEFTLSWLLSHGIEREYEPPVRLAVVETVAATGVPLECDSEGSFTRDAAGAQSRKGPRRQGMSLAPPPTPSPGRPQFSVKRSSHFLTACHPIPAARSLSG